LKGPPIRCQRCGSRRRSSSRSKKRRSRCRPGIIMKNPFLNHFNFLEQILRMASNEDCHRRSYILVRPFLKTFFDAVLTKLQFKRKITDQLRAKFYK